MIPIVLLTGFLGSGKTTLLNAWLRLGGGRAPGGGPLAIVVNELGSVGIDGDLLAGAASRQVELPGGCICCQLDDDLRRTLGELAARRPAPELILIETTGIAEPAPITWSLASPPLDTEVRLRAVVTVVDAALHQAHRGLTHAVDAQVEYADLVAVTKVDLVSPEVSRALVAELERHNPAAPVWAGTAAELAERLWPVLGDPDRIAAAPPPVGHDHAEHPLRAVSVPIDGTLDAERLCDALEALPAGYVRVKGIALVVDGESGSPAARWTAFHRVGPRVSFEPVAGPATPRAVAIGQGVEAAVLASCLAESVLR